MNDREPHCHTQLTGLTPPLDAWERQGALRELSRVARDIEFGDRDAVVARLGRLTGPQRAAVAEAVERILHLGR